MDVSCFISSLVSNRLHPAQCRFLGGGPSVVSLDSFKLWLNYFIHA